MNFDNKRILITGASAGIGAELAKQLAAEANTLILVARREAELERLRNELVSINKKVNIILFAKDISQVENQQAIKDELDSKNISVDILINNAGVGDEALFHKSDLSRLQNIIDLNVSSVVSFTHLFIKDFVSKSKDKGIVFVGSGAGIAWMPGSAMIKDEKPFDKNIPTSLQFKVMETNGDLEAEISNWVSLTRAYEDYDNPDFIHDFFGKMTKEQIGILAYKHQTII
ncbi:MAG: SDR family NAD(P)-dependent oxidoreductase [Flavobacteriales bacterium]|nr:SDR family NAD(P)-dependent oxidoreductase [Flavobacteriales bacterium]